MRHQNNNEKTPIHSQLLQTELKLVCSPDAKPRPVGPVRSGEQHQQRGDESRACKIKKKGGENAIQFVSW